MSNNKIIYRDPSKLSGPRTYFTLLDENNYKLSGSKSKYFDNVEDTLKVLLLTKEHIVIAASHLASKEAYKFFQGKEALFDNKIILPALRSEFSTFEDMCSSKYNGIDNSIPEYFGSVIKEVIPWNIDDNSGWLLDRIREESEDSNSILRANLRRIGEDDKFVALVNKNISDVGNAVPFFSRENITRDIENSFPRQVAIGLNQWIDLLYYISGARVVNCENYLPQENYVKYNLATLSPKRHLLTESEVFHSILISMILSSIYNQAYPVDIIKNLSINDILEFRLLNEKRGRQFRTKYEECLTICDKSRHAADKEQLLLSLEHLRSLADDIRTSFSDSVGSELKSFRTISKRKSWIDKSFELLVNFLGLFCLPVSAVNFIINNCEAKKIEVIGKQRERLIGYYDAALRAFVAKVYKNDPVLLGYIDDIINLHKSKYLIRED